VTGYLPSWFIHLQSADIHPSKLDPSAAAASRRAEFLGMLAAPPPNFLWFSRIPAEFFKRSSQPNIISAQIRREHTA